MIINVIVTSILIALFFFLGYIIPGVKKLVSMMSNLLLKFLNLIGIKIHNKEKHLQMSDEFKNTYKDIRIVKLSKKNIKQKSSIDYVNLALFLITGLLVVLNLGSVSGNAISNWIYELVDGFGFIKSATDMNTLYTATLFSAISFSLTKLVGRWKETKQQRIENKQAMLKLKAMKVMSSKELLDNAKKKDEEKYKELK